MPENIIQIDQNLLETRLDRLITEKMTQILNAMPDASGRREHRGRQIRAQRREEGVQGRPLRAEPDRQGRGSRQGDGRQEAEGRGELPARGRRRDDDLPAGRVPGRAPQAHPHEQHDRTAEQGDPAHARGGQLPRREQRLDARMRAHPVRHRERMVDPPLPGHVPAR